MVKQRFYNNVTKCEIIKSDKFNNKQTNNLKETNRMVTYNLSQSI